MSEEWGQQGDAAAVATPHGPSAGAMLRLAREATGLHIAALAVALKVPVRKLEALEDDRYDLMTDSVFVRGLAASVCRTLKIDPRPILERLPQTTAPRLHRDNEGINTPFRAPGDGPPVKWTKQLTRPVYLVVFALLLGALAVVLFPQKIHNAAPVSEVVPAAASSLFPPASESVATPASVAATPSQAAPDVQVPMASAVTSPMPRNVAPALPVAVPVTMPAQMPAPLPAPLPASSAVASIPSPTL
ncbi:MAG: helix-turn-helix domain-containing protein, partial [Ramlibacter sp.]|nr:helix-turn-helix domain-containing protein [Ramlibacter sp.]